ncbi:hypothetical protein ACVBEQ_22025 [Nakamurella sp. GG22]
MISRRNLFIGGAAATATVAPGDVRRKIKPLIGMEQFGAGLL